MKNLLLILTLFLGAGCATSDFINRINKNISSVNSDPFEESRRRVELENDAKNEEYDEMIKKSVADDKYPYIINDKDLVSSFEKCYATKSASKQKACIAPVLDTFLARLSLTYKWAEFADVSALMKAYPESPMDAVQRISKEEVFAEINVKKNLFYVGIEQLYREDHNKKAHTAIENQREKINDQHNDRIERLKAAKDETEASERASQMQAFSSTFNQMQTNNRLDKMQQTTDQIRMQQCQQNNILRGGINTPCY